MAVDQQVLRSVCVCLCVCLLRVSLCVVSVVGVLCVACVLHVDSTITRYFIVDTTSVIEMFDVLGCVYICIDVKLQFDILACMCLYISTLQRAPT